MTRTFDLDRFFSIPRLSGLRLSPDGRRLAVVVARPAGDGKKMVNSIWQLDAEGDAPPVRLTRSAPGESGAEYLPDGSLLFVSSRPDPDAKQDEKDDDETAALWLLPATGGEARVLAAPPGGIDGLRVASEAGTIVFGSELHPGAVTLQDDTARHKARKEAGVSALLFDSFPIRHWDHYLGPRERRLFAADQPGRTDEHLAEPTDLTPEPGSGLLDAHFDVTADGSTVVTGWLRAEDVVRPRYDLVAIDRTTGARRTLAGDAWFEEPAASPDGRWVACIRSTLGSPEEAPQTSLWLVELAAGESDLAAGESDPGDHGGGPPTRGKEAVSGGDLTPDLDRWPRSPLWAPDGKAIFFLAEDHGNGAVFRLQLASGKVTRLTNTGAYTDLCVSPDGARLFALRSALDSPPVPVMLDARAPDQEPRQLRSPVEEAGSLELPGRVERIEMAAADGTIVESWLVLPPTAAATTPAPLALFIHGGPLSSWDGWTWRWNSQVFAARGYAVLLPDPALSVGYGQAFIQRGWGRWGEEPFRDLMAAVDGALARDDIDAERTVAMGGSFGGYMANWVAGHTDRFKAIVTHASLWELRGFHGTTDWGPTLELEFGDPYLDASLYEAASPHRFVDAIRTPVLVIHGEKDARVPISEGLRLWTDLRRHGVDARFLYFPDENHWILKPQNSRLWYETVLAFLDHHALGREWVRPALV
ncbi:MAG: S9 family peptidase [Chloroflexi bacterium]|nr:S9 family peptidase [Chloroflexota bacterium]